MIISIREKYLKLYDWVQIIYIREEYLIYDCAKFFRINDITK